MGYNLVKPIEYPTNLYNRESKKKINNSNN